jgi:hypothetical protein
LCSVEIKMADVVHFAWHSAVLHVEINCAVVVCINYGCQFLSIQLWIAVKENITNDKNIQIKKGSMYILYPLPSVRGDNPSFGAVVCAWAFSCCLLWLSRPSSEAPDALGEGKPPRHLASGPSVTPGCLPAGLRVSLPAVLETQCRKISEHSISAETYRTTTRSFCTGWRTQ